MLKNILKIEGVQELNKIEQKSLQGGGSNSVLCKMKPGTGLCCPSSGGPCYAGYCGSRGCFWY